MLSPGRSQYRGRGRGRNLAAGSALVLTSLGVAACGGGSTSKTAAGTTSPTSSNERVAVALRYDFHPGDNSGIIHQSNVTYSPCGAPQSGPLAMASSTLGFMKSGSEIVVKDAKGTIVATTTLPTGETTNASPDASGSGNDFTCTWRISLFVPTSDFYTIEVNGHEVGTVSQSQIFGSSSEIAVSLDSLSG